MLCNRNVPQFLFLLVSEERIVFHTVSSSWICIDEMYCREVRSSSQAGKHLPWFKAKGYVYMHRLAPNTDIYFIPYQDLFFTHINIGLQLSHSQYSPLESGFFWWLEKEMIWLLKTLARTVCIKSEWHRYRTDCNFPFNFPLWDFWYIKFHICHVSQIVIFNNVSVLTYFI